MVQSRTIIQYGHPTLGQTAQAVDNISDPNIQRLIDDLIDTAIAANGVGIAAPQVNCSYQLFIVASRPSLRYPDAPKMEPTAMINPRIVSYSEETVQDWEGCLSVPGLRGLVSRYRSIQVEYFDRSGDLQTQVLTDFIARIFQHELDHLNGLVLLDRIDNTANLVSEAEYYRRYIHSS